VASIIYLYDTRTEPCFAWNKGKFAPKPGDTEYKLITVTERTWVGEVVEQVYANSKDGEIFRLRIVAHGDSHQPKVHLGRDGIREGTVFKFKKLNGRFGRHGRIDLHCCSVLNENIDPYDWEDQSPKKKPTVNGLSGVVISAAKWCQDLADFTATSVIAAEMRQQADKFWEFEGPTRTFRPAGWQDPDMLQSEVTSPADRRF